MIVPFRKKSFRLFFGGTCPDAHPTFALSAPLSRFLGFGISWFGYIPLSIAHVASWRLVGVVVGSQVVIESLDGQGKWQTCPNTGTPGHSVTPFTNPWQYEQFSARIFQGEIKGDIQV